MKFLELFIGNVLTFRNTFRGGGGLNLKGAATMTNQRKKTKFSAFINFFLFCLFCLLLFLTKSIFEKTPFFSKFVSFIFFN